MLRIQSESEREREEERQLELRFCETNMAKRITLVLDDGIVAKLRNIQAEQIKKSEGNVSFSKVIIDMLGKSFK